MGPPLEPVRLVQDDETGDRILIYSTEKGTNLELRYEGETLWMTQAQIAELFGVDRTVISKHLSNIYDEGELHPQATSAKIAQVRIEGGRKVTRQVERYNLDAIISVGYRVGSNLGTQFRKWATDTLVQFATKGFIIDAARLKNPDSADRVSELKEIIRDIRADEANVYRELRRICSMCSDYDAKSEAAAEFYARMQAKVMFAVTSHTPSELIKSRANADHQNMGLRTWSATEVRKADTQVSKNYLAEAEARELNRLTVILLDIFEDQLEIGKLTTMVFAENMLNKQLANLGRPILTSGGVVKRADANAHASHQYEIFNERRRARRHAEADAALAALKTTDKKLRKEKPKR